MKSLSAILVILILATGIVFIMVLESKENSNTEAADYAFRKMYPEGTDYQWEVEHGTFEVEIENGRMAFVFDEKGNFLFQEKEIELRDLPPGCTLYLAENFSGEKIREVSEITDAGSNKIYEVEVKNHDLMFDLQGNFIGEEKDMQEIHAGEQAFGFVEI